VNFRPRSRAECRARFGIPAHHRVIAFRDSGFLRDRFKGLAFLRAALEQMTLDGPTTLLIVQDGAGFEALHSKFHIVKTGWIDGETLALALGAADLFVMPSIQESFGLMAVEAMACGAIPVVFDGTALPDVVDAPHAGIAVPSGDSKGLARAMEQLLASHRLREAMAIRARAVAEDRYSASLYLRRHRELYERIAADARN
jgi:glycosyltransferase involved in cell wall biosynthesis